MEYIKSSKVMGYFTPHLPQYPGPFAVGSVDIEIPAPWPCDYPEIDSSVKTLQFRIFYPAKIVDTANKSHPYWFPEDRKEYIKSYVKFLGRSSLLANLLSRVPFVPNVVLPCISNAPLLDPHPSDHKWPVIVFSHGLGGTRNAYSQFCGSMASHGNIVVAPEHRDHSAPVSFVRDFSAAGTPSKEVPYRRMIEVNEEARILRTYQVVQRVREIKSIAKVLLEQKLDLIPADETVHVDFDYAKVNTDLDKIIYSGHSFGAATAVAVVKGAHHFLEFLYQTETDAQKSNSTGEEVVPTTIKLAVPVDKTDEFMRPWKSPALVLLDPWCIPIYETMAIPLNIPAIAIMSQAFYVWKANMDLVYQLLTNSACAENTPAPPKVHLFLTKPSTHHSQSDFALLFPNLTKYAFKLPECTYETQVAVMSMNVNGCVEFLRDQGFTLFDVNEDSEGVTRTISRERDSKDPKLSVSKGDLVADGKVQGWSRLDVENGITVVDILERDI
ncbi:platelet-activating factor acetylhydrolase [Lipomyces arxii]|uniref:platelet-activating factor acetylhydrolase n=1 Tax=Lipomyces arxii TaxID=56418 RepID=UPI0034CF2693